MKKFPSLPPKSLPLLCALVWIPPATSVADQSMLELATARGCFVCHSLNRDNSVPKPLAPSYRDIAERHKGLLDAAGYLAARIRTGTVYSEQNWEGEVSMRFMPPNVNVSPSEAIDLAAWIVSLTQNKPAPADVKHEAMLALASNAGCMTCHDMKRNADSRYVPLAPSFDDIATRYSDDAKVRGELVDAILNGTVNRPKSWEDVNMRFMPPSVALRQADAETLVDWILSLR